MRQERHMRGIGILAALCGCALILVGVGAAQAGPLAGTAGSVTLQDGPNREGLFFQARIDFEVFDGKSESDPLGVTPGLNQYAYIMEYQHGNENLSVLDVESIYGLPLVEAATSVSGTVNGVSPGDVVPLVSETVTYASGNVVAHFLFIDPDEGEPAFGPVGAKSVILVFTASNAFDPGLVIGGVRDSSLSAYAKMAGPIDECPDDPNKTDPGVCGCGVPDTDSDGDGVPDCNDSCPNDSAKTVPGLCGCGVADTDTDHDGTPDCLDLCPGDAAKTAPGLCGCGVADTDTDGDGTPDCNDQCPNDPAKVAPGVCGCGAVDIDSDGDGVADCNDLCPNDPNKTASAGQCGCGIADTDADNDGVADCKDLCPNDPLKTAPGVCGCGVADTDSDGDGVPDCIDKCNGQNDTVDSDGDGTPDCLDGCPSDPAKTAPGQCGCGVAETDSDGDGTPDCLDGCPADPGKTNPGYCGCGVAETDSDGAGLPDCLDGCPLDPEKNSPGVCGCGVADTDTDNDGTPDCHDACPNDPNKTAPGACGCGVADIDTDGDGIPDCNDHCPTDPSKTEPGLCGCFMTETDTDGDGVPDCLDNCLLDATKTEPGVCGCGVTDTDSDGDGTPDCNDLCPNDPAKTNPGTCGCGVSDADSDGDGVPDCIDRCNGQNDTLDADSDGTPDCLDGCPQDPNKTAPGVCGCGAADTDTDDDGTPDCLDNCPNDPNKLSPGVCGCGVADTDSDGDGVPDCLDVCPGAPDVDSDGDGTLDCLDYCPNDPNKTDPGVCGCGTPDTDSDGDGTPDCADGCPTDPNKTSPGTCGCGHSDAEGCDEGCSPGYWKNHRDNWPSPYTPGQDFDKTFGVNAFCKNITLYDALRIEGGGVNALARQAAAALLNAASTTIGYPLTTQEVIAKVRAALARNGNIEATKNELEKYNNLECPGECKSGSVTGVIKCSSTGRAVSGVTVKVYDANNVQKGSVTTNCMGKYTVVILESGTYAVKITAPSGYAACGDTTASVTVACGQSKTANFCVCRDCPPATVSGTVKCSSTGKLLAGVTVRVYDGRYNQKASVFTGADGKYTVPSLEAGNYTIKVVTPCGYDACGNTSSCLTLSCGQAKTVDFCMCPNCRPATLSGTVKCSSTGKTISGVTVKVYDSKNVEKGSATTGCGGKYAFSNLTPGDYTVKLTVPQGYQACGDTSSKVTLSCGQSLIAGFCLCPTGGGCHH